MYDQSSKKANASFSVQYAHYYSLGFLWLSHLSSYAFLYTQEFGGSLLMMFLLLERTPGLWPNSFMLCRCGKKSLDVCCFGLLCLQCSVEQQMCCTAFTVTVSSCPCFPDVWLFFSASRYQHVDYQFLTADWFCWACPVCTVPCTYSLLLSIWVS